MSKRVRARLRVLYARESASSLQSLLAFHVATSRELWPHGVILDAPRVDPVKYAVGTRVSGHVELPSGAAATFQGKVVRCEGELLELAFAGTPGEEYLDLLAEPRGIDTVEELPPVATAPDTLREERVTVHEIPIDIDDGPSEPGGRPK